VLREESSRFYKTDDQIRAAKMDIKVRAWHMRRSEWDNNLQVRRLKVNLLENMGWDKEAF
jgi:hypothetical protein